MIVLTLTWHCSFTSDNWDHRCDHLWREHGQQRLGHAVGLHHGHRGLRHDLHRLPRASRVHGEQAAHQRPGAVLPQHDLCGSTPEQAVHNQTRRGGGLDLGDMR